MNVTLTRLLIAIAFLCTIKITTAQSTIKTDQYLSGVMDRILSTNFRPDGIGCAILVARHDQIIYKKAFGLADLESRVVMTSGQVFRIASPTKQFTAIAVLQLAAKGLLKLDDSLTKFISDYPTYGGTITIANLLSHTSGIKNITEIDDQEKCQSYERIPPSKLIAAFRDKPLDFEPGTDYHYSNSGYILLGYIIEKVSGKSYEEYLKENIFTPLRMNDSYFDDPDQVVRNRAKGYVEINDSIARNAKFMVAANAYAAGALMMTVGDLFKWHTGLSQQKILPKEWLVKASTPFVLKNGKKTSYGFGWGLQSMEGSPSMQHSGSINGFSAFQIYLPDEDVYVALFSNGANKSTFGPALLAASLASGKIGATGPQLSTTDMDKYVGSYAFKDMPGPELKIFKKNGVLFLEDGRRPTSQMHFTAKDTFICYETFPVRHIFTFSGNGKVDGFVVHVGDMTAAAKKIQ